MPMHPHPHPEPEVDSSATSGALFESLQESRNLLKGAHRTSIRDWLGAATTVELPEAHQQRDCTSVIGRILRLKLRMREAVAKFDDLRRKPG